MVLGPDIARSKTKVSSARRGRKAPAQRCDLIRWRNLRCCPGTGWAVLDPALAIVVALNILWSGWGLIRESTAGLMDAAVTLQQRNAIQKVISENAEGAIEAHDLRTRGAGRAIF